MTKDVRDLIADARGARTERDDTGWFWVGRLADALEAATIERDAAEAAAKLSHGFLEIEKEEHDETRAERDAAVAAIERVRAAKFEVDSVHQIHGTDCLCGFSSARSRSRTEHITEAMLAALDGAPEPEGRWEYRGRLQSCGYVAEGYISAEHAMNGLKVELEDHPYLQMDDTATVERARVREWLPVEGESK